MLDANEEKDAETRGRGMAQNGTDWRVTMS
jgi:hypothetical protein